MCRCQWVTQQRRLGSWKRSKPSKAVDTFPSYPATDHLISVHYFYSVHGDGSKNGLEGGRRKSKNKSSSHSLLFFLCTVEEVGAAAAAAASASTTASSQQLRPPLPQLPPSWQGKPWAMLAMGFTSMTSRPWPPWPASSHYSNLSRICRHCRLF